MIAVGDVIRAQALSGNTTSYIYGLREIGTIEVRYVGSTVSPLPRLMNHINDCKLHSLSDKAQWVKEVIERGGELEMIILEICPFQDSFLAEAKWIEILGDSLLNASKPPKRSRAVPAQPTA